jgi:hypothetical protein
MADISGGSASPATPHSAMYAAAGAPSPSMARAASAAGKASAVARSTEVWPRRSTSRPSSGWPVPSPTANAAAAAPAAANDPVADSTRSTIARPVIPIGSRPTNAAMTTPRTYGRRRIDP